MCRLLMIAAGLALLAASAFSAPTQAMPISAPALKGASDSLATTEQVGCWGGGCSYGGGYYGGGWGWRGGWGGGWRGGCGGWGGGCGVVYRPIYRSWGGCGGWGGGCGYYRPIYRSWGGCGWGGGCGGYGYYRPRAYFFNRVYYW